MEMSALNTQKTIAVGREDTLYPQKLPTKSCDLQTTATAKPGVPIEVALLTGGVDKPYAVGLAVALAAQDISLNVIGSDEVDSPDLHNGLGLTFLNFRGDQRPASTAAKTIRLLKYYVRLIRYAATAKASIFHILWHTRAVEYFDRTLLLLYFKLLGKKIAFTAHNINAGKRDQNDSLLNRMTLRIQYRLVDHIFVHTEKMKTELITEFNGRPTSITVLSYPTNNVIPETGLSTAQAKERLGISSENKTILFFGRICPYKGIEHLLAAFQQLTARDTTYRLVIAGEASKGLETYLQQTHQMIKSCGKRVIPVIHFIPDEEVELYFKAADVLVLPYTDIFQSGVLFLAYGFGLPVIATDVGSFRESIVEGKTGFICKPCDPLDLGRMIEQYFSSALFRSLENSRCDIRGYARSHHSSEAAAMLTRKAYAELLRR